MLAEFVQAIAEMARRGEHPHKISQSRHVTQWVFPNGESIEEVERQPDITTNVCDIDSFVSLVADGSLVYVSQANQAVVTYHDPAYGRDCVYMPLPPTSPTRFFEKMREDKAPVVVSQSQAIALIRSTLWGTGMEALLPDLRELTWDVRKTGKGNLAHGKESLGRSVEAAVDRAERIPERVRLSFPWFRGSWYTMQSELQVFVDLLPQTEQIQFSVSWDELSRAEYTATEYVAELIRAALTGRPGVQVVMGNTED